MPGIYFPSTQSIAEPMPGEANKSKKIFILYYSHEISELTIIKDAFVEEGTSQLTSFFTFKLRQYAESAIILRRKDNFVPTLY